MNNSFKFTSVAGLLVVILLFFYYSCKQSPKLAEDRILPIHKKVNLYKTPCVCSQDISSCPTCVREFMGNNLSKTYTITWGSCVAPEEICLPTPAKMTIDFCVEATTNNSCGLLCATIHNPPNCFYLV